MKLNLAGLLREKLPSGNYRYRVRVEGKPSKRIRLHVAPEDKDFLEHYHAARRGIEIKPNEEPLKSEINIHGSLGWLRNQYIEWLEAQVEAGRYNPETVSQRSSHLARLSEYDDYSKDMPQEKLLELRDAMSNTPGAADNFIKSVRVMYRWAIKRKICTSSPAEGIEKINKNKGGAIPWTPQDLREFRQKHPAGTMAHLCLTILMFTACRISDAAVLGTHNEFERDGIRAIGWQPKKKGSAYVEIPMLPPLYRATRARAARGEAYLLTEHGRPFKTARSLTQRFRKWCDQAGLHNRSSHGIRKAAGHLLAQEGCSQYQIMSIHGHTQAKTSEIYTKGAERWKMSTEAMKVLEGMEW